MIIDPVISDVTDCVVSLTSCAKTIMSVCLNKYVHMYLIKLYISTNFSKLYVKCSCIKKCARLKISIILCHLFFYYNLLGTSAPPSPAREHDQEVLSRLSSTAEKQRATLRHQELQLQEKQQLIDSVSFVISNKQ